MAMTTLSDSRRAVLRALADELVPALRRNEDPTGFWAAGGSALGADAGVAQALQGLQPEQAAGILALLDHLHALGFATVSPRSGEQLLRDVAQLGGEPAAGLAALVALTLACAYGAPDPRTGLNPTWKAFGYPGPPAGKPGGDGPIATFEPQRPDARLDCDVCVVGSGAGGGLIAGVLARAGLDVVVLEAGGNHDERHFTGLELPSFERLFWRGGPTPTADRNVTLLAASTLGGGPTVNWSNCLRTPSRVREQWARESGLEGLDGPDFDVHLDAVWRRLRVNDRCSDLNGPHERLRDGAAALGWSFERVSRNADRARYAPESAGHIGFGDRTGAKIDVRQTYLRDAVTAGARVIARCRAERVLVERGAAAGVRAAYVDATGATSALTVRAPRVVVACGALESPALLLRSGIGGPAVGRHLHLHPVTSFMGFYAQEQQPWWGAPMTALVDEFADVKNGHGFLVEGAQWAPSIIAAGIASASGREHKETMARLGHAAWLIGLQRDRSRGTVEIGEAGEAVVRYALDDPVDVRVAQISIAAQIRIHAAAGADEIVPFAAVPARWRRGESLDAFIAAMQRVPLGAGGLRLFSAHQMSSCRMGDDPVTSVADPWGELHDTPGVHIGDAGALPTASGVNPMITTMALAHRTAHAIAAAAPGARAALAG
jgi:choline dehydrogenase-like flavoprotein